MKIVVIGSGFGGLSAACRLQAQGHEVLVLDKRDKPGGRAYVYEQDGFQFDGGPTIITAPYIVDDIFEIAGKKREDYVEFVKLDPFYNIRFEDGSVFHYNDDEEALLRQIKDFNEADLAGYEKLKAKAQETYEKAMPLIDKPFIKLWDMMKAAPDMIKVQAYRSVAGIVNSYLKDHRLRQAFSFHPLFLGGHPYKSSAMYTMVHRLEQEMGVWFTMGGTGALVRALVKLFEECGGKLRLNETVDQILIDETTKRAKGVRLADGEVIEADAVVCNADIGNTYLKMVPKQFRKWNSDFRMKTLKYSMSAFVMYIGTDKKYDNLAHHEIIMGPRYKELLDDIFQRKLLADDFSLYVYRPTKTDPSLAPEGCDAFYILSPVPNMKKGDIDWSVKGDQYRDSIVKYLEDMGYMPELSKHIISEHRIDPTHFAGELNSFRGSAFGVEPTLTQSAWFRPHNQSEDIPNLYLVGAGTHPGAGVPGVLSSGKIVADLIGEAAVKPAAAKEPSLAGA
ncbi:MAG: phytoene desaturase [Synechococcales cyanobacterium RM1_1_8]|nr:phytoene desaturase [Synechococcales cyanobacterium RM1_1_8]